LCYFGTDNVYRDKKFSNVIMAKSRKFEVFSSITEMSASAASLIKETVTLTLRTETISAIGISGGKTPYALFGILSGNRIGIDWEKVHIFWVDERCVPLESDDSNYGEAMRRFLSKISLPPENIHRIQGEISSEEAAVKYDDELRTFFSANGLTRKGFPVFDMILLGMGGDGHTASLFPDSPSLEEKARFAVNVPPPSTAMPVVERISLTLAVINEAKNVLFMTAGADKAELARRIAEGKEKDFRAYPAAGVNNNGKFYWFHSE